MSSYFIIFAEFKKFLIHLFILFYSILFLDKVSAICMQRNKFVADNAETFFTFEFYYFIIGMKSS